MSLYSVWAGVACAALVLWLIGLPLFRSADIPPNPARPRIGNLDGLRGFLALAVFLQHGVIFHGYLSDGVWRLPPSRFYVLIGQVGVALFFMVTGYLFWSILIKERGRPHWGALYTRRVFRIGPLYLAAVATMLVFVAFDTGGRLQVPAYRLAADLLRCLSLGVLSVGTVNGDPKSSVFLAVMWTLQYEWVFYGLLPVLALGARRDHWHLPFAAGFAVVCIAWRLAGAPIWHSSLDPIFALLFAIGMLSASLQLNGAVNRVPQPVLSILALASLTFAFAIFSSAYDIAPALLLGTAFFLMTSGGTIFGLLTTYRARRLGDVAYSVYLLQTLVLSAIFAIPAVRVFSLASVFNYWGVVFLAAAVLVALAVFTHAWIERTGIDAGQRLIAMLGAKQKPTVRHALPEP